VREKKIVFQRGEEGEEKYSRSQKKAPPVKKPQIFKYLSQV
jgi:hypothetical protein